MNSQPDSPADQTLEGGFQLDGLRQILESDEPSMASQIWSRQLEMRVSPFLKPLHADPRWQPLMVEPV